MEGTSMIRSDGPEQVMAMPFTEMGRLQGERGVGREARFLMVTSMGFHVLNSDKDNIGWHSSKKTNELN